MPPCSQRPLEHPADRGVVVDDPDVKRLFAELVVASKGSRIVKTVRPGPALELDQAAVAADEVLRDREAEAGAVRAARHERIEDRVLELGRHARPVVLDLDAGDDAVARGCRCSRS